MYLLAIKTDINPLKIIINISCKPNSFQKKREENKREKGREKYPSDISIGSAKASRPELTKGLSCGWQWPQYLSHQLLPPRVCISRRLECNTQCKAVLKPRYFTKGCRNQAEIQLLRQTPAPYIVMKHNFFKTK